AGHQIHPSGRFFFPASHAQAFLRPRKSVTLVGPVESRFIAVHADRLCRRSASSRSTTVKCGVSQVPVLSTHGFRGIERLAHAIAFNGSGSSAGNSSAAHFTTVERAFCSHSTTVERVVPGYACA